MDDVSTLVARQYEAYAYPEPFADLAAKVAEGYSELGNPADHAACRGRAADRGGSSARAVADMVAEGGCPALAGRGKPAGGYLTAP